MRKYERRRMLKTHLESLVEKGVMDGKERFGRAHVAFDDARALEVAARLKEWEGNKWGFFSIPDFAIVPELLAVKGIEDPADQAQLLYFAVGCDHNVQSEKHYPLFRAGYDADRLNIHPAHIARMTPDEALDHFRRNYYMSMPLVVRDMHESAKILTERYGDDPCNIFDNVSCVHDAVEVLGKHRGTKMPGYGVQLAKLLIKNYVSLGLLQLENGDEAQPKVDRHMKRICISTGVVKLHDGAYHSTALDDAIGEGWYGLVSEKRVDGAWLNNTIWLIGSKRCVKQDEEYCWGCPLYEDFCKSLPATFDQSNGTYTIGKDVRKPLGTKNQGALINIDRDKRVPLISEYQSSYRKGTDRRYPGRNPDQMKLAMG